jgi:hypothetical protein
MYYPLIWTFLWRKSHFWDLLGGLFKGQTKGQGPKKVLIQVSQPVVFRNRMQQLQI